MKQIYAWLLSGSMIFVAPLTGFAAEEAEEYGIWIDVRPAREYRQGHVEGAINIPHGDIGHRVLEFVDDFSAPVHLYDGTGVFAGMALEILMEMGFEYVINEGTYQSILDRQAE